jgi:hypothetical protein
MITELDYLVMLIIETDTTLAFIPMVKVQQDD